MSLADLLSIDVSKLAPKAEAVKKVRASRSVDFPESAYVEDDAAPIYHMSLIQGTSAWTAARLGIPTASQFHRIVTGKGNPSRSAEGYLFELLAERITGLPTVNFKSSWMERGHELESEAVNYYEFQKDVETVPVGFITNAARTIGASPDRLVGPDGLLEIKCPKPSTHVGYLLRIGDTYEDHGTQVQGQLSVSKRGWSDLLSYSPGMPPALIRVERDEPFIRAMRGYIESFSAGLDAHTQAAIERGWLKPDWQAFANAANGGAGSLTSQKGFPPLLTRMNSIKSSRPSNWKTLCGG